MAPPNFLPQLLILLSFLSPLLPLAKSQDASDSCNGIFLSYEHLTRTELRPKNFLPKPYAFTARATITNFDSVTLKSWILNVGLANGTILVEVDGAVLIQGSSLPSELGPEGAIFNGFPAADLLSPIETAGELNRTRRIISLRGTQFGADYMPSNISLSNLGYRCPPATRPPSTNSSFTCCTRDPNFPFNSSILGPEFLPRSAGDISISYDVLQSHNSLYLAKVTITNESPLGRLDNWRLTWDWERGEFINIIRGAYPSITDPAKCINGPQAAYYQKLDFSPIVSCERSPTILDLPVSMANRTDVGKIPFCCRNGTLLPEVMDPEKSVSAFQMEVYKMPPDLDRSVLFPPQNWRIAGAPDQLNPTYVCGPPVRVRATHFPSGELQAATVAIASWQVVCNITRPVGSNPKCCVSFSAFYNDSVVPCKTCACGCSASSPATCDVKSPALLLPSEALLVPFENRTAMAKAWAEIKHFSLPSLLPCGDFCGVSINWHVSTDYRNGWSARMTLFNWGDANLADWFAAVKLNEAYDGFEQAYSFNATEVGNNTVFLKGLPGLNYLIGEVNGTNPAKDPRVPGKLQSVLSFTKRTTPGFDMSRGHGFPTKVIFNGEECSLPEIFPANQAKRAAAVSGIWSLIILLAVVTRLVGDL